ncbi:MAG: hypothetical protein K6E85_02005 [Lachnospiraceae bacterium]|nr:hypothetical protein [Lachnospiraceae bacterium]
MINQYLYGRKSSGYCQINNDYSLGGREEEAKLQTLQNYIVTDECDRNDLPIEYYVYADVIEKEDVRIEGTTFFVPRGVSQQSGSRDTSIIHKYVYSGDDFDKCINSELNKNGRKFSRFVEDFTDGGGDTFEDEAEQISLDDAWREFGVDIRSEKGKKVFMQFAKSCIDAFPEPGKRVYCYLPNVSRRSSLCAKRIMEEMLKVMPASISRKAGFITWQSTFHSPQFNPIPGAISVVFIPDNPDNRQKEKKEKENSKIYDLKNNNLPEEQIGVYVNQLLDYVYNAMANGDTAKLLNMKVYLDKQLKPEALVDSTLLQCILALYAVSFLINKKKQSGSTYESIAHNEPKLVRGGIDSIKSVLEYEADLSDRGQENVLEITGELLHLMDVDTQLEEIDEIYTAGELCRNTVLEYLCDECLKKIKGSGADADKEILNITNYEYTLEDVNDLIIEMLYSDKRYQQVAVRLFRMTISPLMKKKDLDVFEKIGKLFKMVGKTSKQYPEFFTSNVYVIEMGTVIPDLLDAAAEEAPTRDRDRGKRDAFIEIDSYIQEMPEELKNSYWETMQNIGYQLVSEFVRSDRYEMSSLSEMRRVTKIIEAYDLREYEYQRGGTADVIKKIHDRTVLGTIDRYICDRDMKGLAVFFAENFDKNINIIRKYISRSRDEIENFINDTRLNISEHNIDTAADAYSMFMLLCDSMKCKMCLRGLVQGADIGKLISYIDELLVRADDSQKKVIKKAFKEVLDTNPEIWKKQELTEDQEAFLRGVGVDVRKTFTPDKNDDDNDENDDNGDKKKGIMGFIRKNK